jgi:capsular polysaccharide biosynthesis protein
MSWPQDEIELRRLLATVWQLRWIVVAGTCLVALVVLLVIVSRPRSYEATATVVMTSPPPPNSLKRGSLSLDGFVQLANSEAVFDVLRRTLHNQQSASPWIDHERMTAAPDSAVQSITLAAKSTDATTAQRTANAWAAALIEAEATLIAEQNQIDATARQMTTLPRVPAFKNERALKVETELTALRETLKAARKQITILEEEINSQKLKTTFVPNSSLAERLSQARDRFAALEAREAALEEIREIWVEIQRLRGELRAVVRAGKTLATEPARPRLIMGRYASLPDGVKQRSYTPVLLVLPVGFLASLGTAFAAALVSEARSGMQRSSH